MPCLSRPWLRFLEGNVSVADIERPGWADHIEAGIFETEVFLAKGAGIMTYFFLISWEVRGVL
jgi:hypothetical protein